VLAGLAGAGAAPLAAVEVTVNPVRVALSPGASSELLTVTNNSDQGASFQVSAFRWSMNEAGESRLEPTDDLLFFPQLLDIGPLSARRIRVSAAAKIEGGREESFRLIIDELPPERNRSGVNVRLLTRVSLPVFLEPSRPHREARIVAAALTGGRLAFQTENQGNLYIPPHRLRIAGRDGAGAEVFVREIEGWYLLFGQRRAHEIEIPADVCPRLEAVEILADVEGTALTARLEPGEGACSP
jgi:fimbrial chaperone protein